MVARARSFVIVTIITLLVWILAEGQTLRTQNAAVAVSFQAGSNTRIVRVVPGESFDGTVKVRLTGSTGRLEDVLDALRTPMVINVDAEGSVPSGVRVVDLRDALRSVPPFQQSGISLSEVDPAFVQVEVDDLVQRDVPVRVELPDVQLEGPYRVSPETVRFTLPRTLSASLSEQDVYVRAVVAPEQLANLPTGREQTIASVRIVPSQPLAEAWFSQAGRTQVSVTLTLRSRTATELIPTVPVQVRLAPTELERFDIFIPESERFLHDVTVRGPSTLIERMRSDSTLRPIAVVALSFEELERGITSKDAILTFPPGLEGLEASASDVTVSLKITRRPDPAAPAPAGG